MVSQEQIFQKLGDLREKAESLREKIKKARNNQVTSRNLKSLAQSLVRDFFTEIRPSLTEIGVSNQELHPIDVELQFLNELASANSVKRKYLENLKLILSEISTLNLITAQSIGGKLKGKNTGPKILGHESSILQTLQQLNPAVASSYEQALRDLQDFNRVSYLGTANELRQTLWLTLEILAPSKEVESQPGYKHEENCTKPTMRQKVRYILKNRNLAENERKPSEMGAKFVEEFIGEFTREVYTHSNVPVHTTSPKPRIITLKNQIESVLFELLEIGIK